MKKILLFSRDPGGANTVIPLVNKFGKNYLVKLFGKDISLKRYRQFGLKGCDISKAIKKVNLLEIKKLLKKENPDCIITGTSADDLTEKLMWRAAEELDIPSFAIIDHWVNYGIRFSKYGVLDLNKYEKSPIHNYQPNKIFVMDNYVKKEMLRIGFDGKKLIVSGQPYFDLMKSYQKIFTRRRINIFKKQYEISLTDILVTFASEPLEMTYKGRRGGDSYLGYTEKTIIKEFLRELKAVVSENKLNLTLVLKLHPKEDARALKRLVAPQADLNFKIKIISNCNSWDLIMASDLVCGMSSMFLIESVILGRPVISIQIGLKKKDPFILSQIGVLKTILKPDQLRKNLNNILVFKKYNKGNLKVIDNASENIIRFINKFLCQN